MSVDSPGYIRDHPKDEGTDCKVARTKRKSGVRNRPRRRAPSRSPFHRLTKASVVIVFAAIAFVAGMVIDVWAVLQLVFAHLVRALEWGSLPVIAAILALVSVGLFLSAGRSAGKRSARPNRVATKPSSDGRKATINRRKGGVAPEEALEG